MELWIRSQDKIALSQIKQIAIEDDKKIIEIFKKTIEL